jgi:WhiB family redox-sensing transcriptional regulator
MEDLIGGMPSWTEEANCKGADADIFFPERVASTRKAKSICRACNVQEDCLEFAIEQSEKFGIWGGLSERERRRIKRQRVQSFDIREVS